ncbi:MAG: hypothetical protein HYU52_12625 [Acidobacteria bacterium]|nr:hypothetical protein [Acidobacteriota bacterium]
MTVSTSERDDAMPAAARRGDSRKAILVALLAFVVFNANFRLIGASDTYSTRVIPFTLLEHGTLFLDDLLPAARGGLPAESVYWIQPALGGRLASLYPVVTPILVTPLYLPVKFWIDARGWDTERVIQLSELMEKLSASVIASRPSRSERIPG